MLRTLYMNGITVAVPCDTVLEFFYSPDVKRPLRKIAKAMVSKRVVEFSIGGLLFRTKAEIVEEFPDSLFAAKLSEIRVKKDGITRVLLEFESPEMFPMVFDFLLRRYAFNALTSALPEIRHIPALRTVELSPRQSALMDTIEQAVFGIGVSGDPWMLAQEELTGPRYYIQDGMVYVAMPPPGVSVLPDMCFDPHVVLLVLDKKEHPAPKKSRPSARSQLMDVLKRRYALDAIDFKAWDTVAIPRGVPFVFREGADGLEVVVKGCEQRAFDLVDAFRVHVA